MRKNKAEVLASAMRMLGGDSNTAAVLDFVYEWARQEGMLELLALESRRAKVNAEKKDERRAA